MQTTIRVTCVAASMLLSLCAQTPVVRLKPGLPAPEITVDSMLNAPAGAGLDALKGKVVVVDFWATWCGPCVAALPRLNGLVSRYRDKPVQFLFLTDEEQWRVERFLKIHSIAGWVGFDSNRVTFDRYSVNSLPRGVVIDAKGAIAALTGVEGVTDAMIDDALAGKATLPTPAPPVAPKPKETAAPPLYQMMVRPAAPSASSRRNDHEIVARGAHLADILSLVHSFSKPRIEIPAAMADATYEVSFVAPVARKESLVETASKTLETALGIHVTRETQERDVLILRAPNGVAGLRPASREMPIFSDEGQATSKGTLLKYFANVLEAALNRPILDETGASGLYDLAVYWDASKPDSMIEAVRDQLGLELTPARRSIEVMVVR